MGKFTRCRLTSVILAGLFGTSFVAAAPAAAPEPQVTPTPVASGAPNPNACAQIASVTDSLLAASPEGM